MTLEEIKQKTADSIITDHNTANGTMTQHFGDCKVTVVTDFMLKCVGYFIDNNLIHFINPASEKHLEELQQAAFLYHTATH